MGSPDREVYVRTVGFVILKCVSYKQAGLPDRAVMRRKRHPDSMTSLRKEICLEAFPKRQCWVSFLRKLSILDDLCTSIQLLQAKY